MDKIRYNMSVLQPFGLLLQANSSGTQARMPWTVWQIRHSSYGISHHRSRWSALCDCLQIAPTWEIQ